MTATHRHCQSFACFLTRYDCTQVLLWPWTQSLPLAYFVACGFYLFDFFLQIANNLNISDIL